MGGSSPAGPGHSVPGRMISRMGRFPSQPGTSRRLRPIALFCRVLDPWL